MKILKSLLILFIAFNICHAQQPLTSELLEKSAIRFSLNSEGQLEGEARRQVLDWIGENQYVGLAEVHKSSQLGLFTKALLNALNEKGFEHLALEMGPNTAEILQQKTRDPEQTMANIRALNQTYGKRSSSQTPLIFANKVTDAVFLAEASKLGYTYWGLDQEFAGSYEMLVDQIYAKSTNRDGSFTAAYKKAKAAIRKVIFKNKYKGQSIYCWFQSSENINNFFTMIENKESLKIIEDIRMSWDIYCKHTQGGSNQLRANYMKKNFDTYQKKYGKDVKVFTKMGSVHLTHGRSPFGVNDMGKHITEISKQDDKGFLIFRQLIAYRKGKSTIGKSGWKSVTTFLELGRKDQWTLVDLRPFRAMLEQGEITTNKKYAYELENYDILLISPNDEFPKINY